MTRNLVWEPAIARSASWPPSVEGRIIAALPEEALATRGSTGRIRHQQLLSAIRKAAKIPSERLPRSHFSAQDSWIRSTSSACRACAACRMSHGEQPCKKHCDGLYGWHMPESASSSLNFRHCRPGHLSIAHALLATTLIRFGAF